MAGPHSRLVTRIVSSRLATIRTRQREKNTSETESVSSVARTKKIFRIYWTFNSIFPASLLVSVQQDTGTASFCRKFSSVFDVSLH